jgi:hypothetical protein
MDRVFDILERIRQLWIEQEKVKPNTREHEALIEKIRILSAEYQSLIDAPKNPRKSK